MRVPVAAVATMAATVAAASLITATPARAQVPQQFVAKASTWDIAAAQLGMAGSLWEPRTTAGLERTRRISVLANDLVVDASGATSGDTFAGTRYGSRSRGAVIMEKWAGTGWAAEPAYSTSMAKVGTVRLPIGGPGLRILVPATVYANCFPQPADRDPKPVPKRYRCSKASVRTTGGVLMMTARPASTMTAPGDTSIVIQSTGLSYRELVGMARSIEQVAGSAALGAGSAQMVSMCGQMVSQAMTADQARAYAGALGYTLRVGSIDGQPLPGTADYRPERFTVSTVGGAVRSCTYG